MISSRAWNIFLLILFGLGAARWISRWTYKSNFGLGLLVALCILAFAAFYFWLVVRSLRAGGIYQYHVRDLLILMGFTAAMAGLGLACDGVYMAGLWPWTAFIGGRMGSSEDCRVDLKRLLVRAFLSYVVVGLCGAALMLVFYEDAWRFPRALLLGFCFPAALFTWVIRKGNSTDPFDPLGMLFGIPVTLGLALLAGWLLGKVVGKLVFEEQATEDKSVEEDEVEC